MIRFRWLPCAGVLLLLVFAVAGSWGQQQEQPPKLVPSFDGDSKPGIVKKDSAVRPTAFQRMVDRVRPPSPRPKANAGPSALQRLNTNTKRLWAKTKDVFTPGDPSPTATGPKRRSMFPFWSRTSKSARDSRSVSKSWLSKQPSKASPPTLPEFVARPKP